MPAEELVHLTSTVGRSQEDSRPLDLILPRPARVRGVYIHVPFCFHKCHYCDFYSIVDRRDRQEAFADRLIADIAAASDFLQGPIETIFVGGGTPTLLRPILWRRLLAALGALHLSDDMEFTVEANPETVSDELAATLAEGGVNRMSIGAQSFNPVHLKALERWHDPENVVRSVERFRAAGITNLNLDLISAIPGQDLDGWLADLNEAIALSPSHLSCYTLMYEPGTPLTQRYRSGVVQRVDEELEAAMYEATLDRLEESGFRHYEISNWAKPGCECRHNLIYWRNENWWAFGPSASGHVDGLRWKIAPHLGRYLDRDGEPLLAEVECADDRMRTGEQLMLGLRLREGIELPIVQQLLSQASHRARSIEAQIDAGLLEQTATHLRLTRRGLLLADAVVSELL